MVREMCYEYKIVVVGDAATGKTCMLNRLVKNVFIDNADTTVGVDFFRKSFKVEDTTVKLHIWDTAGQENFAKYITPNFYRNASCIMFVFDCKRPETFQSIYGWIEDAEKTASENALYVLVEAKYDLILASDNKIISGPNERETVRDDIDHFLFNNPRWRYYRVSSKNKNDVVTMFKNTAAELFLNPVLNSFSNNKSVSGGLPQSRSDDTSGQFCSYC
ncbi:hypothetical protein GJ496_006544 [Pomphorhynchus laevis]|nr:hypothetical protein GJ496_006544 [Pomphorhynchus laevis]